MDPISLEELALLDVLDRIDQMLEFGRNSIDLQQRLIDNGLVVVEEGVFRLSDAGIERCKSLHHRVVADTEAAALLAEQGNVRPEANAA